MRQTAIRERRSESILALAKLKQAEFADLFGDPAKNAHKWPIVTIGELLESAAYGTSSKADQAGQIPMLRMSNLTTEGELDFTDLKYLPPDHAQGERFLLRDGDILFNRTNSAELVGKTAIFRGIKPTSFAGYLIRLRTNALADPEYICGFLNSSYGKLRLRSMCKSIIGMANINAKEVQSIAIPKPPLPIQRKFAEAVLALESSKRKYLQSLRGLDSLISSLQHRAFRGEL